MSTFKPESAFAPGDLVYVFTAYIGKVKRVTFSKNKVTYDVALTVGGEVVRNIDSCYVQDGS
jgi:hypothetical protein